MKKNTVLVTAAAVCFLLVFTTCGSSPNTSAPDDLDMTLREVSDYLNESIPKGRKIAIINIQSGSAALTEYIIDVLIANAVNDRNFSVVDRQQLDAARAELNFNMSGEVNDQSAQSVGQMLGAQTIITGRISQIGERYRLNIRALEVESVQVQGSNNWNIAAGSTITALLKGGAPTGGSAAGTTTAANRRSTGGTAAAASGNSSGGTASATGAIDIATPLTVGTMVPGDSLTEKLAWLQRSADSHNTYILEVNADENIAPGNKLEYRGTINITIALRGDGQNRTIRLRSNGTMFEVASNVTFILENNITLQGYSGNDKALVTVSGGTFRMRTGSAITGNSNSKGNSYASFHGGGVYLYNETFEMTGGAISGNTAREGGGVYVLSGTFTMLGGTISNNTATSSGGGVHLYANTFILRGGIITGNTAGESGGGVGFGFGGTFTKTGGTITGYNSDRENGNAVKDDAGNVLARKGHAVFYGSTIRKETTAGPGVNLSKSSGPRDPAGAWDN